MEFIPAIAVVLTLIAFIWQTRRSMTEGRLHTFATYTGRYQAIMTHLPVSIETEAFDIDAVEDETKEVLVRWLRAYYDLCSEEHYLNRRGLVDKDVWALWCAGMEYAMRKPAYVRAWQLLNGDQYYSREFGEFVRRTSGRD